MQFSSLGSGSKGNATLVKSAATLVMIDCGFSVKQTEARMERLGVKATELDAILVTHEHSDHCQGVAALSRKYHIPVYLTHGTRASSRLDDCAELKVIDCENPFAIGDLDIQPVAVPHDAREPCQFVVHHRGLSLGILTDLGKITPWVERCYRNCDALVLEFNHDVEMLLQGTYPPVLKRRVGGDWGHLSNCQALELLKRVDLERLRFLVTAHLSEANNCPDEVARILSGLGPMSAEVVVATQSGGYQWCRLG